jgi:ribonuclease-3
LIYASLNEKLGIAIEPALLELALTHSSYSYENGKTQDNERLEFLGDSVLGFIVTDHIYLANPDLAEGELSRLRNSTVSAKTLSVAAENIGLGPYLKLGKGELATGGSTKPNILADAMEAIIGAAFLSLGIDAAKKIIENFIFPLIDDKSSLLETTEPRTVLLDLLKKSGKPAPSFVVEHIGPDHDRTFFAKIVLVDEVLGEGSARSRKAAEAEAAIQALAKLRS